MKNFKNMILFLSLFTLSSGATNVEQYVKINDNGAGGNRISDAKGNLSIAIGVNSISSDEGGISLGLAANSMKNGSIAIGRAATSQKFYSLSLGQQAISKEDESVALGYSSVANRKKNVYGFDFLKNRQLNHVQEIDCDNNRIHVWESTSSAISIGDLENQQKRTRQLIGLAAGTEDTDAVNVAQLKHFANAPVNITDKNNSKYQLLLRNINLNFGDGLKVEKDDTNEIVTIRLDKNSIPSGVEKIIEINKEVPTEIVEKINKNINSIGEINKKVTKNTNSVNEINEKVTNNSTQIEKNTNSINKINDTITENSNNISKFSERIENNKNEISVNRENIKKLSKKIDSIAATTTALALIPQSNKGGFNLGASMGVHKKEKALAMAISGKEKSFVYKLGVAINTQHNISTGIGIGYSFNEKNEYNIQKELSTLKKEKEELERKIDKISKLLNLS